MPRLLSADDVANFRDRLCGAAERLFAEEGPDAVTMRQLAIELGCSPMTPYRYFKDKGEILAAVRTAAFDRLSDALDQAFAAAAHAEDPRTRAQAAGRAYARFALTEPQAYRLMFDLMQPGEASYPDLMRATQRARITIVHHLSGALPGAEPGPSARVIGHAHWAALHGALMLHLADKLGPGMAVGELIEGLMTVSDQFKPRTAGA